MSKRRTHMYSDGVKTLCGMKARANATVIVLRKLVDCKRCKKLMKPDYPAEQYNEHIIITCCTEHCDREVEEGRCGPCETALNEGYKQGFDDGIDEERSNHRNSGPADPIP